MKVVGIGASAGGIEALKRFLTQLSPDTGAAFVIVQHLSPDFKSVMEELLQKYTTMPVQQIHQNTAVESNHIYLMPSDKTITYYQGVLMLHDRPSDKKLNLPIDEFFHSLGKNLKRDAIGVILSGSGTDGSRGARTIKEQDGIVMVQSPDTAEFAGMPNALIQLDIADDILAPEDIARKLEQVFKLNNLLSKNYSNGEYDELKSENGQRNWFEKIIDLTSSHSKISFQAYKIATLERRIEKQMALHHFSDLESYYNFLEKNNDQLDHLYRDFLISVTQFFRNKELFKEVKKEVIPKIFDQLKESATARIWVVACSTGEEAYTFGMLILEYLEENNLSHDFKIFASDVNNKSIAYASKGVYNSSVLANVPKRFVEKYFQQIGEHFQVKTILREKIIFAIHDVIADPPFINMNLISCRNFLIYLKPIAQSKILKTFYFSLLQNQHLVLGPSESLGELNSVFNNTNRQFNIFSKEAIDDLSIRQKFNPLLKLRPIKISTSVENFDYSSKKSKKKPKFDTNPFSDFLLKQNSSNILFLNHHLDVLYLKGNLEPILSLPNAFANLNLEKMLPETTILFFRDAIRKTLESDDIQLFKNFSFEKKGTTILANVFLEKIRLDELEEPIVYAKIEYLENEKVAEKKISESIIGDKNYDQERIIRLENEITLGREKMKKLVQQLEMSSEELNSSNQELLESNQELKRTNEELQSINEELHTVNTELQHKNIELKETNNDISNLLKTSNIGTIFLNKDLKIRKLTKSISHQFNLLQSDIGRSIRVFENQINDKNLVKLCQEVLANGKHYEEKVLAKNNRRHLLKIYPYFAGKEINGIVITLIDIHEVAKECE